MRQCDVNDPASGPEALSPDKPLLPGGPVQLPLLARLPDDATPPGGPCRYSSFHTFDVLITFVLITFPSWGHQQGLTRSDWYSPFSDCTGLDCLLDRSRHRGFLTTWKCAALPRTGR